MHAIGRCDALTGYDFAGGEGKADGGFALGFADGGVEAMHAGEALAGVVAAFFAEDAVRFLAEEADGVLAGVQDVDYGVVDCHYGGVACEEDAHCAEGDAVGLHFLRAVFGLRGAVGPGEEVLGFGPGGVVGVAGVLFLEVGDALFDYGEGEAGCLPEVVS